MFDRFEISVVENGYLVTACNFSAEKDDTRLFVFNSLHSMYDWMEKNAKPFEPSSDTSGDDPFPF